MSMLPESFFFMPIARALRRLAAALVYQHLLGHAVGLGLVLDEVYLQAAP